jgi:mycothiol synthase
MLTERPAAPSDIDAIVGLYRAFDVAFRGFVDTDPEDVTDDWETPGFSMAQHTMVVENDGRVVGYGVVDRLGSADSVVSLLSPEDVQDRLLTWLGTHPMTLLHAIPAQDERTAALLARHGWEPERIFWRMRIDLDAPTPQPQWPADAVVRGMDLRTDIPQVHHLITTAFGDIGDDHPQPDLDEWRVHMLGNRFDPELYLVVESGGQLVAASICQDVGDYAFIRQLAVARDQRGRGLAQSLLRETFVRAAARELPQCQLGVDSTNATGAVRLYESVGMRISEEFVRWRRIAP